MKNIEENYKNERRLYQKEIDERNNKQEAKIAQRKRDLKDSEIDGLKDYKKHLKELKQGYSEPRIPRRAVEKPKESATETEKKKANASPDLDMISREGTRIVKREVKTHSNPEVIAKNHQ